ncbi:Flavin-dependent oxidoreductase, luciferase family (includes alkanesulfonate monooxygenase SsuD and methylene tetrahydromethanopterin reductase) [Parafrankia irregularis]|uniref:Flavin-dependent oxidoreductase, luciferase family (Includes alkanesulfonate monooxygenase SsuD and methylene tetrahydromethanopterin reductase) n=1 Tax=Parafrankia irregularis TaxID=795642 RepID=A0A0S4QYF8_9ACTN|nr:LLM class flavin-dependent oxidoreductase [Parafrankia sp. CH37]CUU60324.1 Flavin-dependent oxidoreductase, luciferase family (includes alkanesulfonate monooxygenase SsuD and methylene tetrahydromethanopterin reductase) [Parafrankia irregularis]
MLAGVNFFPTVSPAEKSAVQFFDEALDLSILADRLGYSSVKIVEHYFYPYGGYSPDPVTFLAAVATRTERIRLITGANIPAFNHPIKLAGQLAMLDNLSHGRLDVGFARAFLPGEFEAFEVDMDTSRARHQEGIAAVLKLWTETDVVWNGTFHRFGPVSMLPLTYQRPHPPVFIAATSTPESFVWAGSQGFNLMFIPFTSTNEKVAGLLDLYRKARLDAGYPAGSERIQMGIHCFVDTDGDRARRNAAVHYADYVDKMASTWEDYMERSPSQYAGYADMITGMRRKTLAELEDKAQVYVGTPADVRQQVAATLEVFGDVEPSMQINFAATPLSDARRTLELFAAEVMPAFPAPDNGVAAEAAAATAVAAASVPVTASS